jgi:hypothetical protein
VGNTRRRARPPRPTARASFLREKVHLLLHAFGASLVGEPLRFLELRSQVEETVPAALDRLAVEHGPRISAGRLVFTGRHQLEHVELLPRARQQLVEKA